MNVQIFWWKLPLAWNSFPYPSVNCTGFCRLVAGSILSSRSLLNSKASFTPNAFNNISFWPHKMTHAFWEASRFTSWRSRGVAWLWDERRWSFRRRAATLHGRGWVALHSGIFSFFWGCTVKSSSSSCWLESGALRFWPGTCAFGVFAAGSLHRSSDACLVFWLWCSRCFFACSSYLQSPTTLQYGTDFLNKGTKRQYNSNNS